MKGWGLIFAFTKTKGENAYTKGPTNSSAADFRYNWKHENERSDTCLQASQHNNSV